MKKPLKKVEQISLKFVLDHYKTKKICEKAVEKYPHNLKTVPDHLKTQEMCNKAVRRKSYTLKDVPDWFVTQQQIEIWDDDDKFFKLYEAKLYKGYQKRNAQKAQIKKELMPIAWHSSRLWEWFVSEDEKKRDRKMVGINMELCV